MKGGLRTLATVAVIAGAMLAVGTIVTWGALGCNTGWTKTYIEIPKTDEVTGIEYTESVQKFVPGLELLFGGTVAGFICILSGVGILTFVKNHPKQ